MGKKQMAFDFTLAGFLIAHIPTHLNQLRHFNAGLHHKINFALLLIFPAINFHIAQPQFPLALNGLGEHNCRRDLTRGGLASALNEIAEAAHLQINHGYPGPLLKLQ